MKAKKSLGQNWLRDTDTLNSVVATANINSTDTVLEIGPGQGDLTELLAGVAHKVIAVELDEDLLQPLKVRLFQKPNVEIIQDNILEYNLNNLPDNYKVVANIPYYLTSNLLRTLLESQNQPSSITLIIQKEVAERITAGPGQMSVLAFSVQYFGKPKYIQTVPKELFVPIPKVDSALLHIDVLSTPVFEADSKVLFRLVRAGFSQKRKMLKNALSAGMHISIEKSQDLLRQSGLPQNARAQELSMAQWQALYTAYVESDLQN